MKVCKSLSVCLVLLVGLAVICMAAAQDKPARQPAPGKGAKAEYWGKSPEPGNEVKGTVASVSASSIAVQTADGVKSFTVNENTKIGIRGQRAAINDIKVNDPIVVNFQPVEGGVPLAVAIRVPKPGVEGKVVAINGSAIVIADKAGQQLSLTTTPKTRYESHGYKGSIADLKVGYALTARGAQQGSSFVATDINFVPDLAKGTVAAVNGSIVTVKTVKQAVIQCQVSAGTAVMIRPRTAKNIKGTPADIKPGQPVNIGFHANPNGTAQLLWIDILTGE